jgi:predicted nicotinamide N-methyase
MARYLASARVGRGKRVLDFGAGSGIAGIAAVKAGALEVVACDLDPLASRLPGECRTQWCGACYSADFFAEADRFDLILVADVLYDRANLPLLMNSSAVAARRWWPIRGCATSATRLPPLGVLDALTLPDLAEPHEFRRVSLYHSGASPYSCPIHAFARSP